MNQSEIHVKEVKVGPKALAADLDPIKDHEWIQWQEIQGSESQVVKILTGGYKWMI